MEKVDAAGYAAIRPLFANLRDNLVVRSILAGHTPAWVYADDATAPQRALLWNRQDALLLAGDPGDETFSREVAALLAGNVLPDAQARHIPQLALFYDPPGWEDQIDTLLRGHPAEKAQRRYYRPGPTGTPSPATVPAGYQIRHIDRALLREPALRNHAHVAGWVASFWPDERAFVERGFGYCLLQGADTIVSWCLTVYKSDDQYELGVATAPSYRRRGFATVAAAACVDHARAHDLTLHWHCWEENAPSIAVAARLGFVDPTRYTVYRFTTTPT